MAKKNLLALFIIFISALGIRLWFLVQLQNDLTFQLPISDPKEFNFLALRIMRHGWLWPSLSNHTPLYAYFIAVIYHIFGVHLNAVVIIQCLLGAFSACLMYLLTLRLANPVAAIVCAELMAFYWFLIYTQVYLFSESVGMTINIILIYYLTVAKESLKKYFLGGLLLGASLLCRPDIGLFAGLILIWIWGQNKNRLRAWLCWAIFLLSTVLGLVPVLMRNHDLSGSWTLRSQIGSNIYLGSNTETYGSNIFIEEGRQWSKFMAMPYEELHPTHDLTEKEINNYYINKTFQEITGHPLLWAKLILGKTWSLLTGREFLRTEDVYFRDLFVMPIGLNLLSTQLIFVLALPGFFIAWKMRERSQLLILLLFSSIPQIFFPAKTRYLVSIMPFVIFFASYFVSVIYEAIRDQNQLKLAKLAVGLLACILMSFFNPLNLKEPDLSESYYALALNLHYQKDYDFAEQFYSYALAINPSNSGAWNDLSAVYFSTQDFTKALDCLNKAAQEDDYYEGKYEMALNIVAEGQPIPLSFTFMDGEDMDDYNAYVNVFRFPLSPLKQYSPPV